MKPPLMGFFKYDLFPRVVAFEIVEIHDDGSFKVKDVGLFHPNSLIAIRPLPIGKKIRSELNILKEEHRQKQANITADMLNKVEKLLGARIDG